MPRFDVSALQPYYQKYLGRQASEDELASHLGNPSGLEGAIGTIVGGPEAREYANRQQQPMTPPAVATPPAATTFPTGLPARGTVGQLTGYPDTLGRSMKHVFGGIASRYGNDRSLLPQLMQDPEFLQWFPKAHLVGDDKIDFGGQLSDFDTGVPVNEVDVSRGGDDFWQWIDQNYVDDGAPAQRITGPTGGGDIGSSFLAALLGGGINDSDLMKRIQEELQKLLAGQTTPGGKGGPGGGGIGIEPLPYEVY